MGTVLINYKYFDRRLFLPSFLNANSSVCIRYFGIISTVPISTISTFFLNYIFKNWPASLFLPLFFYNLLLCI